LFFCFCFVSDCDGLERKAFGFLFAVCWHRLRWPRKKGPFAFLLFIDCVAFTSAASSHLYVVLRINCQGFVLVGEDELKMDGIKDEAHHVAFGLLLAAAGDVFMCLCLCLGGCFLPPSSFFGVDDAFHVWPACRHSLGSPVFQHLPSIITSVHLTSSSASISLHLAAPSSHVHIQNPLPGRCTILP
jgi:hypothetical protein